MDIGKKVRELRQKKQLTQAELAGEQITRNMLSRIEHNQVLPSVPTLLYLAERLQVPPGYLLADAEDEYEFVRHAAIAEIRRAYRKGDDALCVELCAGLDRHGRDDDEVELLYAGSLYRLGVSAFVRGDLLAACSWFDRALEEAGKTVYDTTAQRRMIRLYFAMMHEISRSLRSSHDGEEADDSSASVRQDDRLAQYMQAVRAIREDHVREAREYLSAHEDDEDPYVLHVRAQFSLYENDYQEAKSILLEILEKQETVPPVLLYHVYADLEFCCKETRDYKGAYDYSQKKLALQERLLSADAATNTEG